MQSKTVLIVLDGFGIRQDPNGNAIKLAQTPFLDHVQTNYPQTQLQASGASVGLPEGQMGNSEVGHLNLGAGRIVYQMMTRISQALENGDLAEEQSWLDLCKQAKKQALHLIGLVSDGGVHSHIQHLASFIEMAAKQSIPHVFIHAITDGRDTPPQSALEFLTRIQQVCTEQKTGHIQTICGRFYAMDRDQRWDRIGRAYDLFTKGPACAHIAKTPAQAIEYAYMQGQTDEFIEPIYIPSKAQEQGQARAGTIQAGDAVLLFNFRADRMRQLLQTFTSSDLTGFERKTKPPQVSLLTMTPYLQPQSVPALFGADTLQLTLGEVLQKQGLKQIRIAETEKYAHVTYFFNGGVETPFLGEDRVLVPSAREVKTYDLKPQMSLDEVTKACLNAINQEQYAFILVNFANPDMVGHTGHLQAAILAIEAVDQALAAIAQAVERVHGHLIITSDHGNCEMMIDETTGAPHTAHTTLPVPFYLVSRTYQHATLRKSGILADVAPTVLHLMKLAQPQEMTGQSLICTIGHRNTTS